MMEAIESKVRAIGEWLSDLLAKKDREPGWVRSGSLTAKMAFPWASRQQFYIQLGAQVGNGVRLVDSVAMFEGLARDDGNKALADIAWQIGDALGPRGLDFSEAIAPWIPADESGIIAAGVKGQNLPEAVDQLIETKTMLREIGGHMWSALTNPLGNGVSVLVLLYFVADYLMPQFSPYVHASGATGSVKALFVLSAFATSWKIVAAGVVLAGAVWAFIYSLPNWTGRWRLHADHLWPFSLYREYQGYLWMLTFVAILRAGVRDTDALSLQMKHSGKWLAERLETIREDVLSGIKLHKALAAERYDGLSFKFPSRVLIGTVAALYGHDDFPEQMAGVLRSWSREMKRRMQATGTVFGVISMLLMYGVIIYLMVGIFNVFMQITPSSTLG